MRYLTAEESGLLLAGDGITGVGPHVLSTTRTNAVADAAPAGRERGHPLVVLSPGFTKPRGTLTGLAEDLASHGYVVAGIDHTYESAATAFPDGRVATCLAREKRGPGRWEKVVTGRAADVSFVLSELTGAHPAWEGTGSWDRDWKLLTGWKRWLVVDGAVHASFTDLALLAAQIGIDIGASLPGTRSLDITRAYVRAFFDQHLRGLHLPEGAQALLDEPSPRYPEVAFRSPND